MNPWAAFPFLRYVLCLVLGILCAMYGMVAPFLWELVLALSLLYVGSYWWRHRLPAFKFWEGFLGCTLLFMLGAALTLEKKKAANKESLPEGYTYWLLKATTDGEETPKTIKYQVEIIARKGQEKWIGSEGGLMLYLKDPETRHLPAAGDKFIIYGQVNQVPKPLNPAVFNYKEYLATKGIYYQAFVEADKMVMVEPAPENQLQSMATGIRNGAAAIIEQYVPGKQEADIVKAMVLGVRERLDEEIMQAYATAGVMHVLAVSGLHVGFIYAFLNLVLRYWRRDRYLRWLGFGIVLWVLWSYALITGFSASVVRATFMFTMLDLALRMKRRSSIYNTLAAAAFVLLLYDPNNIWNVGFQLSFLAVAAIVYMAPKIISWYNSKNMLVKKIWSLVAVSLAAQVATFPLGLYYFGQFPTYFFITNLVVVPASGLILGVGFLLLLVGIMSNTMAFAVGYFLNAFMQLINGFVLAAEGLPYSRLSGSISEFQLSLLFTGIIGVLILLRAKTFPWALVCFLVCFSFLGSLIYQLSERKQQRKLVVYHLPGYSFLHLLEGVEEFYLADPGLPEDRFRFQVQPHRKMLGLLSQGKEDQIKIDFRPAVVWEQDYTLIVWRGRSIVIVQNQLKGSPNPARPPAADFLLISHNAIQNLDDLLEYFTPKMLLIDGSNKSYLVKKIQQQAENLNLPYHITAEKGAFEVSL